MASTSPWQPTFRYGGVSNPDISSGSKMILDALQTPSRIADGIRQQEAANFNKKLKEIELARQQKADRVQDELIGWKRADREKESQEAQAKDNLAKAVLGIDANIPIKAVKGNEALVTQQRKAYDNAMKKQVDKSIAYTDAYNKLINEKVVAPTSSTSTVPRPAYKKVYTPGSATVKYVDPETGKEVRVAENRLQREFYDILGMDYVRPGEVKPTTDIPGYEKVTKTAPKYDQAQAAKLALKKAGLDREGIKNLPDLAKFTVNKLVMAIPAGSREMTSEELRQAKIDTIHNLPADQVPATLKLAALNELNKPTASLEERKFAYQKQKDVAEMSRKEQEFAAKLKAGYYSKKDKNSSIDLSKELSKLSDSSWYEFFDNASKDDKEDALEAVQEARRAGASDRIVEQALRAAQYTGDSGTYINRDNFFNYVSTNM